MPVNVELHDIRPIGPFDFRWPDATEHFDHGWDGTVDIDGRARRFRHGIGNRVAYGRPRVHSVTWLDGQPIVEGVETDDYERSRALISEIKRPDRKLARALSEVPEGYRRFLIVTHRDEIDAPYSRNGLAVKLREDDLEGWLELAVLRVVTLGRRLDAWGDRRLSSRIPQVSRGQHPALQELATALTLEQVAEYLRAYEEITGYDVRLEQLRERVDRSLNLEDEAHRAAVIDWLRGWGCRHLRRKDEHVTSAALLAWSRETGGKLPHPEHDLVALSGDQLAGAAEAYNGLCDRPAAARTRESGDVVVTFGPTATAKLLFALRPRAFLPWDEPIRTALGFGGHGLAYRRYLEAASSALRGLAERAGIGVADLPARVGRPGSTPAKIVDEYLWARITRRFGP